MKINKEKLKEMVFKVLSESESMNELGGNFNKKVMDLKKDIMNAIGQKVAVPFKSDQKDKSFDQILDDIQVVIDNYRKG